MLTGKAIGMIYLGIDSRTILECILKKYVSIQRIGLIGSG
jgi:hypothetical protein